MTPLDPMFYLVAVPAVIFAGISKAGFGSGAAFVAAAILAIVVDPGFALGVMLPLLMLIDVASLRPYWRKWDGPSAKGLIIGAVPGVAIGALVYSVVNADSFRLLIGIICLAFVVYQWARAADVLKIPNFAFSRGWAWVAGSVAGFTSFVSHAGGPPVAVFTLGMGMDKTRYQATSVIVFWAINLMKFIPYGFLGIFTAQTLLADLILAPAALLGAWIGVRAHHYVSERLFFGITYVALTLTGLRLIWLALS
ncbi:sulfite exporter TauE/SafE family protein [Loktanella sp. SALINAS62]|uniref:sulfite exporter TauE/SafE family protein n=1 Tax=Loktanella sp. SALINAS62 TaxID=2706124 RepID=UPI001B8ACF54|nr:sulfite exporter TauE/SafE family protein [Loktanella sp. SALINAS62]MBS1302534.1 sulfite exporter TauE/SafE family protein [Loktanella sp. SALINAS62]